MRSLITLFAVVTLFSASGCSEDKQETVEVARPLSVIKIKNADIGERKYPGEARATDAVTLAFEVPGKLNEITVDVGDKVKKGQVLASLDSRDFKNAVNAADAEMLRASAQYKRIKQAADLNAVSKQQLTDALAAFEGAKAELAIRKKALEDSELKAPYDAVISAKYVDSFSNVQAKQAAIRIVNPDAIEMVVDIPEDLISQAREELKILASFDAFPDREFTAHITEIGAEADPVTRTFPVTLAIEMPEGVLIKPGMTGRAWPNALLNQPADNFNNIILPVTAIGETKNGDHFVWVVSLKTGLTSQRQVTVGQIQKSGVIVTGVEEGELVAAAGIYSLKEGQQVRPVITD